MTFKPFLGSKNTNALILKVIFLSWLLTKWMTRRIWTTGRLLPTAPICEYLDRVPAIAHVILFGLSIAAMIWLIISSNKYILIGLLVIEICLCSLDQNRLTPLEYLYCFILFIYIIYPRHSELIPISVGLLLVSTYFYGGLCKLNDGFLQVIWSRMILRGFLKIPADVAAQRWLYYSGYLLGITELLGGVGLLFKRTQARSALSLIIMHLFILVFLGPFGLKGYMTLWPWNIAMILFLYLIFLKKNEAIAILPQAAKGWGKLIVICWIILPAFSFWGYWDNNLSSKLWSGNVPRMIICIRDTSKCKPLQRFCSKKDIANICHGQAKIELLYWAGSETGVSAYSQMRTYHIMQKKIEAQYTSAGLTFVYLDR
ncbi:hypothetical protein [Mucilaginibacter sp. BT774]|uniref:hypothetical protein n=1 Tax=Mucilaginibacter sp. BT774 TaxID=3062276 RepID=UPI00267647D5|nr:hypothetical protein [Mucilaginibacter sp. BT774]MDO3626984.1 hypothetical protein [Mucilaginibacter sp. BT774]